MSARGQSLSYSLGIQATMLMFKYTLFCFQSCLIIKETSNMRAIITTEFLFKKSLTSLISSIFARFAFNWFGF